MNPFNESLLLQIASLGPSIVRCGKKELILWVLTKVLYVVSSGWGARRLLHWYSYRH